MAVIKIDDVALEENARNMIKYVEELNGLNGELGTWLAGVNEEWKGTSGATFVSTMQGYVEKSQKVINVLEAVKQYIDETVLEFRELDQKAATIIRQSF